MFWPPGGAVIALLEWVWSTGLSLEGSSLFRDFSMDNGSHHGSLESKVLRGGFVTLSSFHVLISPEAGGKLQEFTDPTDYFAGISSPTGWFQVRRPVSNFPPEVAAVSPSVWGNNCNKTWIKHGSCQITQPETRKWRRVLNTRADPPPKHLQVPSEERVWGRI